VPEATPLACDDSTDAGAVSALLGSAPDLMEQTTARHAPQCYRCPKCWSDARTYLLTTEYTDFS
jgi:hypothetical protein